MVSTAGVGAKHEACNTNIHVIMAKPRHTGVYS